MSHKKRKSKGTKSIWDLLVSLGLDDKDFEKTQPMPQGVNNQPVTMPTNGDKQNAR